MKIAIVTGGTGGHIYPALALADQLKDDDRNTIYFIGNDYKMESWIIPEAGYEFYGIHNGGLQGSFLDRVKAVISQFKAERAAQQILQQLQPDVVIAFGGYVSGPVGYAAHKLRIPLILHEQNSMAGKANKLLARYAAAIVVSYPMTVKQFKNKHVVCLGNPRASLARKVYESDKLFDDLKLKRGLRTCLIVMGSQGASTVNEHLINLCNHYSPQDFQIIITTGPNNFKSFASKVNIAGKNIILADFVDQLALLSVIELIVTRAGASALAEVTAFGVPSIVIPSPYVANNHQYYNALAMVEKNACVMLEESQLSANVLYGQIDNLIHDDVRLMTMRSHAKELAYPNACDDFIALIKDVVHGSDR